MISVGADNPYGHPTAATLATLAAHGVRTLRTDRDGTVVIDVGRGAIAVATAAEGVARPSTRLGPMAEEMRPLYLIAGTDGAKIDATRARLRARAEREGGAGGAGGLRARRGAGDARPRGAAGGDPGDVADGVAPLPARRRGRALARPPAGGGRRARSASCRRT